MINGVSEQPSAYKLPTQGEYQLNGVSSVVDGLKKRPPTSHSSTISNSNITANSFMHTLDYGSGEFYTVVISATVISVFDKDGASVTLDALDRSGVAIPPGSTGYTPLDYLSNLTNPKNQLVATTIADQTYIINKTKVVEKNTTNLTDDRPYEGLIYVKNGDYKTEYKVTVTVNGTNYTTSYTTRDSSNVAHEPDVQTTNIINNLYNGLNLPSGLSKSKDGNIIRVYSSTTDFKLKSVDDRGGTHMFGYKGQIADFKRLPAEGPLGFKIKVIGNNTKQQDDYYVQLTDPDTNGTLVWKEVAADAIPYEIYADTMPHVLVKEPDGTFHFKEVEWADREVGDEETNEFPSFIGQTINDLFFYRNRLGLLSGENVVLSEVGGFWNFFHTTTLLLSDASPIDIAVSTNQQNVLKYAVPFNDALMLFADNTQFTLASGQVLAHDTVTVEVATRFEADLKCKPVGASTFVFFATKRGEFGGLREYYVASDLGANDATNVTSHVPELIAGNIKTIAVSTIEDMVVVISSDDPSKVFIYNYYWVNKEKKQSAWHTWDVGGDVVSAQFIESKLILIVKRGSTYCLEKLNLSADETRQDMTYGYGLHLDRRVVITTDAEADASPHQNAVGGGAVFYNQSGIFLGNNLTAAVVKERLAMGDTVYSGYLYDFEYRFSEFLVRQDSKAVIPTNLKLKTLTIEYDETGSFEVAMTPSATALGVRASYTKRFGPILGSITNVLNKVNISSGKFQVPVWGDAPSLRATLKSGSVFPCSFQTAQWTATYSKQSKGA
jgi:hypothetical protein